VSVLIPPGGDASLELAERDDLGGPVADVGRECIADVTARALAGETFDPSEWDLLPATAAAHALRRLDTPQGRMRALAMLLRARRGGGVRLRLDAVVLARGTAERSADVQAAAAGGAPYDDALQAAVDRLAEADGRAPVHVVIERDQQLPGALAAVSRLRARGTRVLVTGRYATARWAALRRLDGFSGASLRPAPRGLAWRVAGLPGSPTGIGPRWRELPGDPEPDGPWAGRLALRDLAEGQVWRTPEVAVIGVCDIDDRGVLGRSGRPVPRSAVRAGAERIASSGGRCVVEFWVGSPGADPGRAAAAAAAAETLIGPVVGVRMFEWPPEWTVLDWGGTPVRVGRADDRDLARAVPVLSPPPAAADALDRAVEAVAADRLRRAQLVPGRLAAAYLESVPLRSPAVRAPALDCDLVILPDPGGSGMVAVNTRLGLSSRLPAEVMSAVQRADVRSRLSRDKVAALRARGILADR
jgi:hypothetical protein